MKSEFEYGETLDVLMMLSEEERLMVPNEIMIENVTLRTDSEVRDELLNKQYDTAFITKGWVRVHGSRIATQSIKLLTTLTPSRVHYITDDVTVGEDPVVQYMKSIGNGNITALKIDRLDISTFRNLSRENRATKKVELVQDTIHSNLTLLENKLRMLPENMVQDYVRKNRGELIDVISSYLTTIKQLDVKNMENQNLLTENQNLRIQNKELDTKYSNMKERRNVLSGDLKSLRKSILTQKDKIEEYNERLLNNEVVDEPIIELDEMSPIILYFKEMEDVGFFDFYESILYTLKDVYKRYVKSMVMEVHSRHYFDPYTDLGYITIPKDIKLGTVIDNDKLVRYGNPTNLLKAIANPEFRTEIIMIYDRTHTEQVLVNSPYLYPFYVGRRKDRIKTLDIPDIGWISPTEGKWKSIKPLLKSEDIDSENKLVYNSHVSKHILTDYVCTLVNI